MTQELDIDKHRARGNHIGRTPHGRIADEHVAMPENTRRRLADTLRTRMSGDVLFSEGDRALYATDASNYRMVPLGVVRPRSADDAAAAIAVCHEFGAAVTPRGAGTGLAGGACNVAVIFDFSRYMDHVLSLDFDARRAEVEPGCILDTLRDKAEDRHLTFGPDPSTHGQNAIGGMLGNNSCGVHSVMGGRTSDNVHALDIVTHDGTRMTVGPTSDADLEEILAQGGRRAEIYRDLDAFRHKYAELLRTDYPDIPRRVSGFENLEQLLPEHGFNVARALVGTEATCVTILGATLDLMESPEERVLAIIGFKDVFAAADAVPDVLDYGPIGLEGIDDLLIDYIRIKHLHGEPLAVLPEGKGWLIAEFGGHDADQAAQKAKRLTEAYKEKGLPGELVRDSAQQAEIWQLREAALAATAHVPDRPESWPGWEDSAVPRRRLGDYLRELKALFDKYGYVASVYGHFGDGLVHTRIPFNLRTEQDLSDWQAFLEEAADLVGSYGGTLSGEHGDGEARAELLDRMYAPEMLQAFRDFKAIWDPDGLMNPGRVVDPFPITANLRVGPRYQPEEPEHFFAYPEDDGSFARATRRCIGVGICRRPDRDEGVMCPSYMATREEKYATRGRAHLLFEMLHGDTITDGFKSEAVEEALDMCLACKGCKSDCPVHVDMATYKAEFRARHYKGRLRPRTAYTMGLIHRWARLGGAAPGLANLATGTPGLSALAKRIGGIAPQRTIPKFAPEPFTKWFEHRKHESDGNRPRVVLWPDTFNNYFRSGTAQAAVRVLESLGFQVSLPKGHVCCGRPLYDWGRLSQAKALWRRNFDVLSEEIAQGVPIVGLEPSCVSAFRDELPGLFPGVEQAERLSGQTRFLTEFLDAEGVSVGDLSGTSGKVQMHCHHHAVLDEEAERHVLERTGMDCEVMQNGCCGMAGAFGFEAEKYEVSQTAAERALLPRLRETDAETAIIANGFSCREQIEQLGGRQTLHVAEVLEQALSAAS